MQTHTCLPPAGVAGQIVDADAARQGSSASGSGSSGGGDTGPRQDWRSPVYALVAVQALAWLATGVFDLVPGSALGLSVRHPQWWQMVANSFLFSSAQHLAETVFLTYVLGRLVERLHGAQGLWAVFLASTLGANLMTLAFLPQRLSAAPFATPAGVLGLFVVGLLVPRLMLKPLEVACLAPFVCATAFTRYV
jgi:membrane associated rhomboid family serine protease